MAKRISLLAGIVIGVAACGMLLLRRGPGAAAASAADTTGVARLAQEIERLSEQVRRTERLAGVAVASAAAASSSLAGVAAIRASGAAARREPDPAAERLLTEEEARRRLGDRFNRESTDGAWVRDAEPAARQHLGKGLTPASAVRLLECRRTMCRSVLVHHDQAAYAKATTESIDPSPADWSGTISYGPPRIARDGTVEVEEYLFRPGENPLEEIYAAASAEEGTGR